MPKAPGTVTPRKSSTRRQEWRGSAAERGYDWTWKKLRDEYAAAHPLCEHCQRNGIVRPMREVDHIQPITGPDDDGRLDWNNLQSLCRSCHQSKTHRDKIAGTECTESRQRKA